MHLIFLVVFIIIFYDCLISFVKYLLLGIQIKTATLGFNNIWRHVKCSMIIDSNKRCKFCEGLYSTFRVYKKRSLEAKSKYIGPILTPNRKKKYCDILKKKNLQKSNSR